MKIVIGSDHAGYRLKELIKRHLAKAGYIVIDVGTFSEEPVDYPDIATAAIKKFRSEKADRAILICGTGIGMSIAANKFRGVRAALCWNVETAMLSRLHNDANVLCLAGRILEYETALKILDVWFKTGFKGGRHLRRLGKIKQIENENMCED